MFVLKLKLKNPKVVIITALSVLTAIIFITVFLTNADFTPQKNSATSDEIEEYSLRAETASQRTEFFEQLGIKAEMDTEVSDSVQIPCVFNDTYNKYNEIQRKIGLDLQPYKGKNAERFTYRISDSENYAVILVYKGNVIAGHITSGLWGSENQPLIDS